MQKTVRRIFHARLIPLVTYIQIYNNILFATIIPLIIIFVTHVIYVILLTWS